MATAPSLTYLEFSSLELVPSEQPTLVPLPADMQPAACPAAGMPLPRITHLMVHYGAKLGAHGLAALFPNLTELHLNNADGSLVSHCRLPPLAVMTLAPLHSFYILL